MMNERERLIKLLDDACFEACKKKNDDIKLCHYLADNLLENGVIVPPAKVGDTVYIHYKKKVYPVKVYAIRYDTKTSNKRICVEDWLQIDEWYQHSYKSTFKWGSIGKTVFLTREEAVEHLRKETDNGDNDSLS